MNTGYNITAINNEKQKVKQRDEIIDIVRAVGILLMVMGHVGFGELFSHYIHAFHMPIFFIISGMFYHRVSWSTFFKKRIRNLVIPYAVFGALHFGIWCLLETPSPMSVKNTIWHLAVMTTSDLPIAKAMWFLPALFACEMIWKLVDCIRSESLKTCVAMILTYVGFCWNKWFDFRLPWSLDIALASLGMFYVGYLLRKVKNCKNRLAIVFNLKGWVAVLLFALNMALCLLAPEVNVKEGRYGNLIVYHLNAVLAFVAYYNMAKMLCTRRIYAMIKKLSSTIGRNSIIFLCFNQLTILLTVPLVQNAINSRNVLVLLAENILETAIVMGLLTALALVVEKTWLSAIIGRKKVK